MKRHNSIVAEIAAKVSQFHDKKIPFRISHGSTNSTRHNVYNRQDTVDTGELNRVLDINTAKRTALIEPNVPMDRLVATTLQYGLVPPVVMEFPGITSGVRFLFLVICIFADHKFPGWLLWYGW
jgi:FAD/FMN-containing dehydrogenase